MQTNRWIAVALFGIVAFAASAAVCAPVYRFQFDSTSVSLTQLTDTSWTVSLSPGQSFSVSVYLYEDMSGGGAPVLNTVGLQDSGLRLTRLSPASGAAVLTGITANAAEFNDSAAPGAMFPAAMTANGYTVAAGTLGGIRQAVNASIPPHSPNGALGTAAVVTGDYRILLGTFNFTAGGTIGIDTVTQAEDLSSADETVNWDTGNPIDSTPGISTSTLTVSVVPEPPSIVAFLGLALSGGAFGWLRLRGRRSAAQCAGCVSRTPRR